MKYEKFIKLPLPPSPLPAPRYQTHDKALEGPPLDQIQLDDTADECILIRSQMYRCFRASEKHTTASELTRDVDLFTLGALRLARSFRTRRLLYYRRLVDLQDRVQMPPPVKDALQSRPQFDPIRSSENTREHIFINNPLVLSDLARRRLEPLLFPEKELFPGRGRPAIDLYAVLEGILYKFLAGISWSQIPHHYPSPGTCNRYYLAWKRDGTLSSIMAILITLEIDVEYENEKQSEALFSTFFKPTPVNDAFEENKT
jgi:transposase